MIDIAVDVAHVWKKFHRGEIHDSLRDFVPAVVRRVMGRGPRRDELAADDFWALRDVSFQVRRGEVLGIVGANGAGKSTLLKILARILKPSRGSVQVNGRLRALIEVAAGFHGDLTGRENVYLNGTILGMKKREIDAKFDQIVEFSGIGQFLDMPVKRYSSGMYARLGFAVAAHLDPEILVVDEVLAVGDFAFQRKCLGRMQDVAGEGRTVLFVSHNMASVQAMCTRAILLKEGSLQSEGSVESVIAEYLSQFGTSDNGLLHREPVSPSQPAWYTAVSFSSTDSQTVQAVQCGSPLEIRLEYEARGAAMDLDFIVGIYDIWGTKLLHLDTRHSRHGSASWPERGTAICCIPRLPLPPGTYRLNLGLRCDGKHADHIAGARIDVLDGDFFGTGKTPTAQETRFLLDHAWRTERG